MRTLLLVILCCLRPVLGEVLVPLDATWKFARGTAEPPADWRSVTFNDDAWPTGPAPFFYGENLTPGTLLSDMRNTYTTLYTRRSFLLSEPAAITSLSLRVFVDDGYIIWINGQEVTRYNVAGDPPFDGVASVTIEPTWLTNTLTTSSEFLQPGTNVIAVQVLNRPITSSDLVFNLELEAAIDTPPSVAGVNPSPGHVNELSALTVTFSEPVQGVRAEDLLINNSPARQVTGSGTTYTFSFPQPAFGPVDITWESGHVITDFSAPPRSFDGSGVTYQYELRDAAIPFLASIVPPQNSTVRQLASVEIQFSEEVTGVTADDLLINGIAASGVVTNSVNRYTFQFPAQPAGTVNITWSASHGIRDVAANAFVPEGWSCSVNPTLPVAQVILTEFLASAENPNGLKDEDGELQDWIELHNSGTTAVNLNGWSLTDDPEEPGLWTFPNISLAAGARIVVFASAKDRKPTTAGSRLHTSFKLTAGGEYLALFNADAPRVAMSEFANDFPEQRNDYSYGLDANEAWRYFQTPTPGQPNGTTTITGVVPKPDVSPKRGWHDAPFLLHLTNSLPGVTIRYTTDGTIPTETTGTLFTSPFQVSSNLVLRAAAFRANHLPSEILTHTYLFAEQVLRQPNNPAGFPVGPTVHAGYPSDYEMDAEIVNNPTYASDMVAALKALPVVSIVLKTDDMFGAVNGIYTHPLSRGPLWERPCSMEFIPLSGPDFQEDAGIQIQGNAAREPQKQPKHPFRVTFKGDYGAKKLDYRMFPDSPVTSFDTLILRADFNFSWLHWNPTQRIRSQRIRDAWVKDSMRAMGGLASHNRYVNLFINGLYWGIYDPSERPDGSFGEAYLGGEKEDYDVINEGAVVDGTGTAYNALLGFTNVSTPAQYAAIKEYLDMPQFIDYMLLHFYMGHEDWGNIKNWYMIRPRDGSRGFLYIPWDGEMVLGDPNINRVSNSDVPSGLHTKLIANTQYKLDFADRVHRHFFNDGALTPSQNIVRWQSRTREIELPIIAESARWGDYRRDVHPFQTAPYELYTRDNQWRTEQNRLLTSYFPNRTTTVLNQLRNAGLYPSVVAPSFNQHGGAIEPGFRLQMTAPAGTIYYTADGTDPRVYESGLVAPQAQVYANALALNAPVRVKARVFSGGNWSALTETLFTTGSPRTPLRITEIMYNPDPAGDAFEFIELQNLGSIPFDATSYSIAGVDYIFPPQSILDPGQIIVLGSAENPATFAQRYPGLTVFGRFGGQLLNRGERLALVSPIGQVIQSVDFDDDSGWPEQADGGGFSLEISDPFGDPDDPANWHTSAARNGSPGAANSPEPVPSPVRISEVQANTANNSDWVELYATEPASLAGWTLSEGGSTNTFIFPADASFPGGAYQTVWFDRQTNAAGWHAAFGLDSDGETLILRNSVGIIRDVFTFGPQASGYTAGIISNRTEFTLPTPLAPNQVVELSSPSLVINELLANPLPGESDWIEIHNQNSQSPASLRGLFISVTNQLFEITSAAFIGPGGYVRLFADEAPGPNHLDLKLPASGGVIRLLDANGMILDEIHYGPQAEAVSYGRLPDGTDTFASFTLPTPGTSNAPGFPIAAAVSSGQIQLSWPSISGQRYRIEYSENLSTWTPLSDVTASSASSTASDSTGRSQRYYRVVTLP